MPGRTKTLTGICLCLMVLVGFAACAGPAKEARPVTSSPMCTDVFVEVRGREPPRAGTVTLSIKASVKTPTREHFLLEKRTPPPEKGGYPFELNVDGQEIIWKVEGKPELTPISDERGRTPEGGEGIRYVLDKTIRLAPGTHHVVFGVPYDDYWTEVKLFFKRGHHARPGVQARLFPGPQGLSDLPPRHHEDPGHPGRNPSQIGARRVKGRANRSGVLHCLAFWPYFLRYTKSDGEKPLPLAGLAHAASTPKSSSTSSSPL